MLIVYLDGIPKEINNAQLLGSYLNKSNTPPLIHREDGPAIIEYSYNGKDIEREEWWRLGKLHRIDGPAIEVEDGSKEWWVNGQRHRLDAPAIKYPGREYWFQNGKLHRLNGPAVVTDRNGFREFYLNGVCLPYYEFKKVRKWL